MAKKFHHKAIEKIAEWVQYSETDSARGVPQCQETQRAQICVLKFVQILNSLPALSADVCTIALKGCLTMLNHNSALNLSN